MASLADAPDLLFAIGHGRGVRVVTRNARKPAAARRRALAFRELLDLAHCSDAATAAGLEISREHGLQFVAGAKIPPILSGVEDAHASFEMTLFADTVAYACREFGGIDDVVRGRLLYVLRAGTVTAYTGDRRRADPDSDSARPV